MNFHDNHRLLFGTALALFVVLTIGVAIMPALHNQATYQPLPNAEPLSESALAGKMSYIANGCVACHTQQVRNIEMDEIWGDRPSIAADYAGATRTDLWRNTATLMGTERTGPDLMTIGSRQPSQAWHLIHLYNPRAVVPDSIMPAYPWMFEEKREAEPDDVVVNMENRFKRRGGGVVVAKQEALDLVEYLLSLKHTPLPDGTATFIPDPRRSSSGGDTDTGLSASGPDGSALYAANCQACHQSSGTGLPGAFPPLKDSGIVLQSPDTMVAILMKGHNSRKLAGYPEMPPIAVQNNLDNEEIHAIINYVRNSWGNSAPEVSLDEVNELVEKHSP